MHKYFLFFYHLSHLINLNVNDFSLTHDHVIFLQLNSRIVYPPPQLSPSKI